MSNRRPTSRRGGANAQHNADWENFAVSSDLENRLLLAAPFEQNYNNTDPDLTKRKNNFLDCKDLEQSLFCVSKDRIPKLRITDAAQDPNELTGRCHTVAGLRKRYLSAYKISNIDSQPYHIRNYIDARHQLQWKWGVPDVSLTGSNPVSDSAQWPGFMLFSRGQLIRKFLESSKQYDDDNGDIDELYDGYRILGAGIIKLNETITQGDTSYNVINKYVGVVTTSILYDSTIVNKPTYKGTDTFYFWLGQINSNYKNLTGRRVLTWYRKTITIPDLPWSGSELAALESFWFPKFIFKPHGPRDLAQGTVTENVFCTFYKYQPEADPGGEEKPYRLVMPEWQVVSVTRDSAQNITDIELTTSQSFVEDTLRTTETTSVASSGGVDFTSTWGYRWEQWGMECCCVSIYGNFDCDNLVCIYDFKYFCGDIEGSATSTVKTTSKTTTTGIQWSACEYTFNGELVTIGFEGNKENSMVATSTTAYLPGAQPGCYETLGGCMVPNWDLRFTVYHRYERKDTYTGKTNLIVKSGGTTLFSKQIVDHNRTDQQASSLTTESGIRMAYFDARFATGDEKTRFPWCGLEYTNTWNGCGGAHSIKGKVTHSVGDVLNSSPLVEFTYSTAAIPTCNDDYFSDNTNCTTEPPAQANTEQLLVCSPYPDDYWWECGSGYPNCEHRDCSGWTGGHQSTWPHDCFHNLVCDGIKIRYYSEATASVVTETTEGNGGSLLADSFYAPNTALRASFASLDGASFASWLQVHSAIVDGQLFVKLFRHNSYFNSDVFADPLTLWNDYADQKNTITNARAGLTQEQKQALLLKKLERTDQELINQYKNSDPQTVPMNDFPLVGIGV